MNENDNSGYGCLFLIIILCGWYGVHIHNELNDLKTELKIANSQVDVCLKVCSPETKKEVVNSKEFDSRYKVQIVDTVKSIKFGKYELNLQKKRPLDKIDDINRAGHKIQVGETFKIGVRTVRRIK